MSEESFIFSDEERAKAHAMGEMMRLEAQLPDAGPREIVERIRVSLVEIGDRIWDAQDWCTVTAIREPGRGPNEIMEPQRHFMWMGNDHWHHYGEWVLRWVGDA